MFKASANIGPSRFVKRSGTNTVATCGAGERMIGISGEASGYAPLPSQTEYAAASGDPVTIYMVGDGQQEDRPILLIIGSGGCTQGDLLKSDASGGGVTASTDKDCYGALALESGSAGEAVRVRLLFGYLGA
jgi:hypothetical protein